MERCKLVNHQLKLLAGACLLVGLVCMGTRLRSIVTQPCVCTQVATPPYCSQLHILVLNCVQISMMPYYFSHDCKHRAFSHVLQGSEVLDLVMTRRQSSSSAHPLPSLLDRMELEKLYGRLVLCSHSPREPSISPALFPAPFFPRSDMFQGPPPSLPLAENWVEACGQSYQSPMSL